MAIISQETWDNMTQEEKDKIIKKYNWYQEKEVEEAILEFENLFGKENLQPKPKIRTWEDVFKHYPAKVTGVIGLESELKNVVGIDDKIAQKIIATAKIAKLIELGYGGMVTEEENNNLKIKKFVPFYYVEKDFVIECLYRSQDRVLCFHTQQQAKEFMSYPENVELVRQYYLL